MKLYHATPEDNLESIFARGLLPREMTNQSTYDGACQSRTGLVYLSRLGLLLHGLVHRRRGREVALVEVDVRVDHLLPDEDYLANIRMLTTGETFEQAVPHCDPRMHPEQAMACLQQFGSAAHDGPIPAKRICRVAIVADDRFWAVVDTIADLPGPVIAPVMQEMIRLAFGDVRRVTSFEVNTPHGPQPLTLEQGTRRIIRAGAVKRRAA